MNKKTTLVLAIAGILGSSVAVTAQAGIQLTAAGTDATPAKYALEIPSSTTAVAFTDSLVLEPPLGAQITNTNPAFLKVNLLGGAKFKGPLALTCDYSGAANVAGNRTLGGSGYDKATFQLNSGKLTANNGSGCTLAGLTALTLSGLTDKSVSAVLEYNDAGVAATRSYRGSLITFARALGSTFSAGTPSSITIDVAQAGKKFVTGSTNFTSANLGYVKFSTINSAARNINGAVLIPSDTVSSFDVQVAGAVIDAVATKYTAGIGVFLVTAGEAACNSANAVSGGSIKSGFYSGTKVTFKGVPVTADVSGGLKVCIQVDGTTPMEKGQITATLTPTPKNSYRPDASSTSNNLRKLVKNGSSDKVFVLPKPGATDVAFVRLYNTSSVTGKVLGTLYNQDTGAVLGSGTLVDAMAPKKVAVLDQNQIAAALGVTTWTGRAWLQVDSEFKGLQTQALMRSPNGVLTDFSAGTCNNSVDDTLCGDTE